MNIKKNILGLDLGTNSIGFARVKEDTENGGSSIEQIGVRVINLSTEEQSNFEKGKAIATNAERTLKRSMRRSLNRYKLRRDNLIELLLEHNIINKDSLLTEEGTGTTYSTYALRAKAASTEIPFESFARVLLAINKKRGYKSSRKVNNKDDGQIVDGMLIAKKLYEEHLSPGQLSYQLLLKGNKNLPDFYRSDLKEEFSKVWSFQEPYHPEILTPDFKKAIDGKPPRFTAAAFWINHSFNCAENKGSREEKKLQAYQWRSDALTKELSKEALAYVLTEINKDLCNASGYLGAISDRSKELYFTHQTVGQYLYKQLQQNPHVRTKGQVFYRQDYLDEFEQIWETQSKFHPELIPALKSEIRDMIIFYQRKLKSQKGLVSFCEFESKEIEIEDNHKQNKRRIGLRVAPKSSPIFQEFKIWQILGNLSFKNKATKEEFKLDLDCKKILFEELNLKGNITPDKALKLIGYKSKEWEANYSSLEGNHTNRIIFNAFIKILDVEGYNEALGKNEDGETTDIASLNKPASEIIGIISTLFEHLGINTNILRFNAQLNGKDFESQDAYQLWHLLYSYTEDRRKYSKEDILLYGTENIGLKKKLCEKFGFKPEHSKILGNISFVTDYGNLSTKAIRNIYPHILELSYDKACTLANYKHSANSLTVKENAERILKPRLELLKKNELRSPVVEKILNQMVNLVNCIIDEENKALTENGLEPNFHFDEIRIELARELKKNAAERQEMTSQIKDSKQLHEKITQILQSEFGIPQPTRKDIIRYKLYEELKNNGYHDLYSNTYIPREILFGKEIDVDHIIPQMSLFDDSFSNKTIIFRKDNQEKGNKTAFDYISQKYGNEGVTEFIQRITSLYEKGAKTKEEGLSKAKFKKLQITESEIGDGFIERDLRETQYIAKKAKNILLTICRHVVPTTGEITARLRQDWGLVNVMQEINLPKFRTLGLTEMVSKKDGGKKERITDWSKRNDHRHHAMDALTIAFTKHSHIQYLNHLNARKNENNKFHTAIIGIEQKETENLLDELGNKKRIFKKPMPNFRELAKQHLETVLISHNLKNKVVTKNKNKIITKTGTGVRIELTPRGQLHKETIYGKYYITLSQEEKVGAKFDEASIQMVTKPLYKKLLLERLRANNNDPKKAFTGKNALSKTPIYLDASKQSTLPEKVKITWMEEDYSIRKDITPDNFKDIKSIEKIIDDSIKKIITKRLEVFDYNPKSAFSNLDENPIWLNEKKGIAIKRVTISGIKNAIPLHFKKDNNGKNILDKNNQPTPIDFVSTGNNHHIAIYQDEEGNYHERVVSFFDAVQLISNGLPVIDKEFNSSMGWKFQFTMKQNELFVFPNEKSGFIPKEIDLFSSKNKVAISENLFRVQKISTKNYFFRHHLETTVEEKKELKGITYKSQLGLQSIKGIVKIRLNHIGRIVEVGEY